VVQQHEKTWQGEALRTVDTDFVFKYKGERVIMKYEENNKIER
jgi:hypothetical protein